MVNALIRTSSAHPITGYPTGIRKPRGLGFLELFSFKTFERQENSSAPEPPVPFISILLPFHSWRHSEVISQFNLLSSPSLGALSPFQVSLWILLQFEEVPHGISRESPVWSWWKTSMAESSTGRWTVRQWRIPGGKDLPWPSRLSGQGHQQMESVGQFPPLLIPVLP